MMSRMLPLAQLVILPLGCASTFLQMVSILRLPTTLLVEIFLFTLATHWGTSQYELYARTTLRLVCQEWNTTLLRSPRCWSRIVLNLGNPWLPHYALRIFLHRSAPVPLSISLALMNVPTISNSYLNRYLNPLCDVLDRWESFSFTIGEGAPGHLITYLDQYKFQRALVLKDLHLGIHRNDEYFSTKALTPIANIIGSIPALLHLKLDWWLLGPRGAQYLVEHCRVEALNSLEVTTYSSSAILVLARFALSAISLTLTLQLTNPLPAHDNPPIFAVSLRALRYLRFAFYADHHHLLQVLNAPLLTVLCIQSQDVPVSHSSIQAPRQELYTVLLQYLTNSRHSIRVLVLSGIDARNVFSLITNPAVTQIPVVEIIYDNVNLFDEVERILHRPEIPETKNLCTIRQENNYGLVALVAGWVDADLLRLFEETRMDPHTPQTYGIFAYRALRWKHAILGD